KNLRRAILRIHSGAAPSQERTSLSAHYRSPRGRRRTTTMAKMRVAAVSKPGADIEIQERDIPAPVAGQVRIRVQACGVCHSDVLTKEGGLPGMTYPRVPGHEVSGVIDAVGAGVKPWREGQRVGVGWHGRQDGICVACRRGDFGTCPNLQI